MEPPGPGAPLPDRLQKKTRYLALRNICQSHLLQSAFHAALGAVTETVSLFHPRRVGLLSAVVAAMTRKKKTLAGIQWILHVGNHFQEEEQEQEEEDEEERNMASGAEPKTLEKHWRTNKAGEAFRRAAPAEGTWPRGEIENHWKASENKQSRGRDTFHQAAPAAGTWPLEDQGDGKALEK